MIVHTDDAATVLNALNKLGADSYIDFKSDPNTAPVGKTKLLYIPVRPDKTVLDPSVIEDYASVAPGATWYVGGEPNVSLGVDQVIEDYFYYYTEIMIADPTAKITSPSMLNWEFTCIGCGGYTSGKTWMTTFIDRYQELYATFPPWHVWAIDVYPIDWWNLPNNGFTAEITQKYAPNRPPAELSVPAQQVAGYRTYIDSLPGHAGDPIIITELGVHWGYESISFPPGCGSGKPDGAYDQDGMIEYFKMIFGWLEQNAVSSNIERWFTFITYADLGTCRSDAYAGISLMDGPGPDAQLSPIGEWYKVRSRP